MNSSDTKKHYCRRIINLPFFQDTYNEILDVPIKFREQLGKLLGVFRELFPKEIANGYELEDLYNSKKFPISTRRILIKH